MLLDIANDFKNNLPIYLPFTFALLSIIAGIATERISLSFGELLKVHGDMILGLFSFVTWGLVTYFQSGRVDINGQHFIDESHVFFLLVLTFALLLVSIIALRHKWSESRLLGVISASAESLQNWVNGSVLLICCVVALFPFFLKQEISAASKESARTREYRVAIPFADQSLVGHVGEYRWKSRTLCSIEEVIATSRKDAQEKAVQKFLRSDLAAPIIPVSRRKSVDTDVAAANPVSVINERILISEPHR